MRFFPQGHFPGIMKKFFFLWEKEMIKSFPFVILGIHVDNGSEYINYQVAKLLKKLLIELTKSQIIK